MSQSLFPAAIPFPILADIAKKAIAGQVDLELAQMATYAVGCGLAYMEANMLHAELQAVQQPSRTFTSQSPKAIGERLESELLALQGTAEYQASTQDDGNGNVRKIDPATLLLIFTAVTDLLKLFLRR